MRLGVTVSGMGIKDHLLYLEMLLCVLPASKRRELQIAPLLAFSVPTRIQVQSSNVYVRAVSF
jgi:hypothetical protein